MIEHASVYDEDYEPRASIKDLEDFEVSAVWADIKDLLEGKLVKFRDLLETCESGKVPKTTVNVNLGEEGEPSRVRTLEELQAAVTETRQFLMYPEIMRLDLMARANNRINEEQENG